MKTLELYISTKDGGEHHFQVLEGLRRSPLEPAFTSASSDAMLEHARQLMESDNTYEPRIRIYDARHLVLKGGDVTRWVKLETLLKWFKPGVAATAPATAG